MWKLEKFIIHDFLPWTELFSSPFNVNHSITVTSPVSTTKYVYAKSAQCEESISNKSNNGKGNDKGVIVMTDRKNRTKMYLMMVDVITILTIINPQDRQNIKEINPFCLTSNLTNSSNLTSQDNFNEKAFFI